jgi:hypothetical protein
MKNFHTESFKLLEQKLVEPVFQKFLILSTVSLSAAPSYLQSVTPSTIPSI